MKTNDRRKFESSAFTFDLNSALLSSYLIRIVFLKTERSDKSIRFNPLYPFDFGSNNFDIALADWKENTRVPVLEITKDKINVCFPFVKTKPSRLFPDAAIQLRLIDCANSWDIKREFNNATP